MAYIASISLRLQLENNVLRGVHTGPIAVGPGTKGEGRVEGNCDGAVIRVSDAGSPD